MFPEPLFSVKEARRLFFWIGEAASGGAPPCALPPDLIEKLKSLVMLWAR